MRAIPKVDKTFFHSYILQNIRYIYYETLDRRRLLETQISAYSSALGNPNMKSDVIMSNIKDLLDSVKETIPYISYGQETERKNSLEKDLELFYAIKNKLKDNKEDTK